MMDYDYMWIIRERTPLPAQYEQFAEECVELAHAALKYARLLRGESPTPVTAEAAFDAVQEEANDVHLMAKLLYIRPDRDAVSVKLKRWVDRLEGGTPCAASEDS